MTPLGAPGASLGYGPMFRKKNNNDLRILGIFYYSFFHTVFVSDQFFLKFGFKGSLSEKKSKKSPEIQWFYISIGYYNEIISNYLGFSI